MNCDKCNQPVDPSNDATAVVAEAFNEPLLLFINGARHFLPTDSCPGSPSRAQYIEGQPRDTRGYPYDQTIESAMRRAYAEIQKGH